MTDEIQQVVWELEVDYLGHPYYVSGKAIRNALDQNGLSYGDHQHLSASHGMFVPEMYGVYPDEHSQSGGVFSFGANLHDVVGYDDLFLFRHAENNWHTDTKPRDALNTYPIRKHSGQLSIAPSVKGPNRSRGYYIHAYLHADRDDILPLGEGVLDGVQFGGSRNLGYGSALLEETQMVDLHDLDYSRLYDTDEHLIEIVTPFVLESEYPGTNDVDVPSWWTENRDELRLREEKIVSQGEEYSLLTVDHGQVVEYAGDRPVETAKNALTRVGSHSRYGFGELRVKPLYS